MSALADSIPNYFSSQRLLATPASPPFNWTQPTPTPQHLTASQTSASFTPVSYLPATGYTEGTSVMPQQMMPHKPTLGWAVVAVIVIVLAYHMFLKKR